MPILSQIKYSLGLNKEAVHSLGNVIVEAMAHGLIVINSENQVALINPAAERILDMSSPLVLGRSWYEIVEPLLNDQEIPFDQRPEIKILKTGKALTLSLDDNFSYQIVGGRKFPASVAITPLMNDGFVSGAVILLADITDEKAYREASQHQIRMRTQELRDLEFIFESSINSLNVGFLMVDDADHITFLNNNAKRVLFNRSHPESNMLVLNPQLLTKRFSLDDLQSQTKDSFDLRGNIGRCIKERKPIEVRGLAFGNRFLHIFFSPIALLKDHIEVIGCVILFEDITSAIILERSKDDFLSIASHELRTPLTAVWGNTSILKKYYQDKISDPNALEILSDIHEASRNLIDLVKDFLDTSRLEQGKMVFKKEAIDMAASVNTVFKQLQTLADQKKVYLKLDNKSGELPKVFADKEKVQQILVNLVGNAIKFTDKGGITVELQAVGDYMIISVVDTGRGIDKENQKLLFRKFQQARNSMLTRETTRGTGLGLYICKLIIDGMGGAIYLEKSEPETGSTFVFSLPIAEGK